MDKHWPLFGLAVFSLIITAIRISLATELGLAPDEAYYWRWSSSLALAYPDHPPLIAWLIRCGTTWCGDTSLGIRFSGLIGSCFAIAMAYMIGRLADLNTQDAASGAMMSTLLIAPASAALITTPDTPLGLAWLAAMLSLVGLAKSPRPFYWYLLGAAFGLGVLAKYTAWLIPCLLFLGMWVVPRLRQHLGTVHPWCGAVIGLLIISPHLVVTAHTGFGSVLLQMDHLLGRLTVDQEPHWAIALERLGGLMGGQIALLTPLVAGWAWYACRHSHGADASKLLAIGLLLPIGATTLAAFFTHPEQNWASLGHPFAPILALIAMHRHYAGISSKRKNRYALWVSLSFAMCLAFFAVVHLHALHPFLPLPAARDPVSRLQAWSGLRRMTAHLKKADAVVCDNYGLAAELAWYLRRQPRPIPIVGIDREPPPAPGTWLLLDQKDDWGQASLHVTCRRTMALPNLPLTLPNGELFGVVEVSMGYGCR